MANALDSFIRQEFSDSSHGIEGSVAVVSWSGWMEKFNMKRSLFLSLMALSGALQVEAQEAIHDTSSNVEFGRSSGVKDKGTRDGSGRLYKTAIGIFRGKLKQLTDKEIVIENQSNQIVSIRRSHKTKFFRNNEPIHPADIDLETLIMVEVTAKKGSLAALNVSVDTSVARMSDHFPER